MVVSTDQSYAARFLKDIDIRPVDDVAEVIRAALVCEPPVIADTPLELPLTAPQPAKPGMYKGV